MGGGSGPWTAGGFGDFLGTPTHGDLRKFAMIFYIDKPGFYQTFGGTPPALVPPSEMQRQKCGPLVHLLVRSHQKALVLKLLARHDAKNVRELRDDDVPVFLAELEAVALALGLE